MCLTLTGPRLSCPTYNRIAGAAASGWCYPLAVSDRLTWRRVARFVFLDGPDLIVLIWWCVYILVIAIGGLICWAALIALLWAWATGSRWGW